jgi:hypothetical protein
MSHRYAMETNVVRYAKIALQLPNKTVRDVALRCRWMTVSSLSLISRFMKPLLNSQHLCLLDCQNLHIL